MNLAIIAVDPGNVTGIDMLLIRAGDIIHRQTVEVPWLETGDVLVSQRAALAGWHDPVHVAVEKYVMTGGLKSPQPYALMTMGVVEDHARRNGWKHFYYPVKTCKTIGSDGLLRKLKWHEKTKDGHCDDARRVTLTHLANAHQVAFGRLTGI